MLIFYLIILVVLDIKLEPQECWVTLWTGTVLSFSTPIAHSNHPQTLTNSTVRRPLVPTVPTRVETMYQGEIEGKKPGPRVPSWSADKERRKESKMAQQMSTATLLLKGSCQSPYQVAPLIFQKAFHGGVELLAISGPQVLQQLLWLVQILFQVGFHDCLGMGDSVIEDRRLRSVPAPRSADQWVPLDAQQSLPASRQPVYGDFSGC